MPIKSVSGLIHLVKDLDNVTRFYETLGFDISERIPGTSSTACLNRFWIEFLHESQVITEELKGDIGFSRRGAGSYLHIMVDDVDQYYQSLLEKELQPLSSPRDFPWGRREFVLQDSEGFKLVFFSNIK